jgi:hypothetical protein
VGGRVHDADARLALGHGRVADGHGEHTLLEQAAAELLGQRRFAQHHRHDGRLAIAGVEAHRLHLAPEQLGVRPQPVTSSVDSLRMATASMQAAASGAVMALLKRNGRPRCRNQSMMIPLPRHQPADNAERLAQRAHFHVDPTVQAKVIDDAAPAAAQHALAVGVVDHQDRAVLLGHVAQASSGAMSPSMLKTPSLMISRRR